MRLIRLKLENWRGVVFREVEFAQGVTLIEGPNEIGKSTIVEAIHSLFTVMDSSNKADIKAVQPVGQDVGSSVEAEVQAGEYHFVYNKTYNKNKQTELRVLSPQQEQLTGRQAHERAEQILEEAVDMALWNALLVEQGNEIAGVTLSQSDGLARALDEAAGGQSPEQDDSDLFARVQQEYEQYFTKTGRAKYAALEGDVEDARTALQTAKAALAGIETDSASYERCQADIRRLENELPELEKDENKYEADWQAISKVKEQIAAKQGQLQDARELLERARETLERRHTLNRNIDAGHQALQIARQQLAPKAEQLASLKQSADKVAAELKALKLKRQDARAAIELRRADVQYLEDAAQMKAIKEKLAHYQRYSSNLEKVRKALQGVKINPEGLEALRQASNEFQIARAKLDTATSSIELTAAQNVELVLNEETLSLAEGATERRAIASEAHLAIPGLLSLRITPSQSANELESAVEESQATLERLLEKYGVSNLADAVALEAKRAENQRDAESWGTKIEELLGRDSAADLQAALDDLQSRCTDYITSRVAEPPLPDSLQQAQSVSNETGKIFAGIEKSVEDQQSKSDELRDQYNAALSQYQLDEQEISGQQKFVQQQQQELEQSRSIEQDAVLARRVEERLSAVDLLGNELQRLQEQLESAAPDTAEALFTNARAARQRAANELATQRTALAVLEDRLSSAQANGRFEAVENAEHKLMALQDEHNAVTTRAAAASRLWRVLNVHRDAARKAYVRPLKEGVERLGRIVFGSDFSIELDDNWQIMSRSQHGRTIAFDNLSIGAKEQLGILMRLAAARIVSGQGGVPLIIDDALGFSDPDRLKTMGAAIASAGNDCQIILLTCTPGRFTHVGSAQVVRF